MTYISKAKKAEIMSDYCEYTSINQDHYKVQYTGIQKETKQMAKTVLEIDTIINFGKHKGKTVEDLLLNYPDYVHWMKDNNVREFGATVTAFENDAGDPS